MFKHFISLILITYLSSTCVNANIISTCARSNLIALTFDDGPSWDYANILYILKQNDIKATFFLVGRQLNGNSELTRRAIQEGHNIGSHTYSHPSLTSLNSDGKTNAKKNKKIHFFILNNLIEFYFIRNPMAIGLHKSNN